MIEKKIAWEKFTPNYSTNAVHQDEETDEPPSFQEEEELDVGLNLEHFLLSKKIKTPFGAYEVDDPFSPYNMFECWIGHTNFKITDGDFDKLDTQIDGIGCLAIISPYRFFIGIEKLFTFPVARIQIQKILCNNLKVPEHIDGDSVDSMINAAFNKINESLFSIQDSEKWAVFIGDDGTIETIKSSEFSSELEYLETLTRLKKNKNGNIITYDSL
tara:strand:- start:4063 stop:4707 length:645 start_codon:yes stop_codon:yes gene_type:complete